MDLRNSCDCLVLELIKYVRQIDNWSESRKASIITVYTQSGHHQHTASIFLFKTLTDYVVHAHRGGVQ